MRLTAAQEVVLRDADAGSVLTPETPGRWRWGSRRGSYLTATLDALVRAGALQRVTGDRVAPGPRTQGERATSYRLTREGLRVHLELVGGLAK